MMEIASASGNSRACITCTLHRLLVMWSVGAFKACKVGYFTVQIDDLEKYGYIHISDCGD